MLKERRFNIVLITKEQAHPLKFDDTKGTTLNYNGKSIKISL
jgi:alpha-D-xyloside xylohydrolase